MAADENISNAQAPKVMYTPVQSHLQERSARTFYAPRSDLMRNQRFQGQVEMAPGIGQQELPFARASRVSATNEPLKLPW